MGLVFDADEAKHPFAALVSHDKPAITRPIVQGIAATLTTYRGAGEEAAHLSEKYGLVVVRAELRKFAIFQAGHEAPPSLGRSDSTSRWAKPKDSERAMSCLSSESATRRQDGCFLRFSNSGTPASGHCASG